MPLQGLPSKQFKGKVRRFLVIPICTVEDEEGNPIRDEKGKPFTVLLGNLPDFKQVAKQLEVKYDREYFSKLNSKASKVG
jgi:hypothetical protein